MRLSPTEVSINLVEEGIKIVYGGGFPKHEWYPRVFGSYGYGLMLMLQQYQVA